MAGWKTYTGAALLFIGGGLEALGVTGALVIAKEILTVVGVPLVIWGLGHKLDKQTY